MVDGGGEVTYLPAEHTECEWSPGSHSLEAQTSFPLRPAVVTHSDTPGNHSSHVLNDNNSPKITEY